MASTEGLKTFSVDGVFYPIARETRDTVMNTTRTAVVGADGAVHYMLEPREATITVSILTLSSVDFAVLEAKDDCHAVLDYGNGTTSEIEGGFVNLNERGSGQIECVVTGKGKRGT